MIDAAALAQMQATAAQSLDIPGCVVRRKTTTLSAYATAEETWSDVAAVSAGMAEPKSQLLQQFAARIASQRAWVVSLPYGTDVRRDDELVLAGRTLRVQADLSLGSYSTLNQVLATEVY